MMLLLLFLFCALARLSVQQRDLDDDVVAVTTKDARYFNVPMAELVTSDLYLRTTKHGEVVVAYATAGSDLIPGDYISHADGVRLLGETDGNDTLRTFVASGSLEALVPVFDEQQAQLHGGKKLSGFVMLSAVLPRKLSARRGEVLFDMEEGGPAPSLQVGNVMIGPGGARTTSDRGYVPAPKGGGKCISSKDCFSYVGTCTHGECVCKGEDITGSYCQLHRPKQSAVQGMMKRQALQRGVGATSAAAAAASDDSEKAEVEAELAQLRAMRAQEEAQREEEKLKRQQRAKEEEEEAAAVAAAKAKFLQQQEQEKQEKERQQRAEEEAAAEAAALVLARQQQQKEEEEQQQQTREQEEQKRRDEEEWRALQQQQQQQEQQQQQQPEQQQQQQLDEQTKATAAAVSSNNDINSSDAPVKPRKLKPGAKKRKPAPKEKPVPDATITTAATPATTATTAATEAAKEKQAPVHIDVIKAQVEGELDPRERYKRDFERRQKEEQAKIDAKLRELAREQEEQRQQEQEQREKLEQRLRELDAQAEGQQQQANNRWFDSGEGGSTTGGAEFASMEDLYGVGKAYPEPYMAGKVPSELVHVRHKSRFEGKSFIYAVRFRSAPLGLAFDNKLLDGCRVEKVAPGLQAEMSDVKAGDFLVAIDQYNVSSSSAKMAQRIMSSLSWPRVLVFEARGSNKGMCTFVEKANTLTQTGAHVGVCVNNEEGGAAIDMPKGKEHTSNCSVPLGMVGEGQGNLLMLAATNAPPVVVSLAGDTSAASSSASTTHLDAFVGQEVLALISENQHVSSNMALTSACAKVQALAEELVDKWPRSLPHVDARTIVQTPPFGLNKPRGASEEGGRIAVGGQHGWAFFDYHLSNFGPQELPLGPLKLVFAMPPFGCDPNAFTVRVSGAVVAILRGGGCSFGIKVINAQKLGALAVIIVNVDEGKSMRLNALPDEVPQINIPSIMVSRKFSSHIEKHLSPYFLIDQHVVSFQPTGVHGGYDDN